MALKQIFLFILLVCMACAQENNKSTGTGNNGTKVIETDVSAGENKTQTIVQSTTNNNVCVLIALNLKINDTQYSFATNDTKTVRNCTDQSQSATMSWGKESKISFNFKVENGKYSISSISLTVAASENFTSSAAELVYKPTSPWNVSIPIGSSYKHDEDNVIAFVDKQSGNQSSITVTILSVHFEAFRNSSTLDFISSITTTVKQPDSEDNTTVSKDTTKETNDHSPMTSNAEKAPVAESPKTEAPAAESVKNTSTDSASLGGGAIAGIVAACVITTLALAGWIVWRKRNNASILCC